jgi:hypothetical protein
VSTQTSFAFQEGQGYLFQALANAFLRDAFIYPISLKRRQQGANIFGLFPGSFSFLPDQVEVGGYDGIAFQQSLALSLAGVTIGREALVFGMSDILRESHLEGLWKYRKRWRLQGLRAPIMDIDVRHFLPTCGVFLEYTEQRNRRTGKVDDHRR